MPLPSSGPISLNQMHVEVGGTSGTTVSMNDSDIRGLIGKASGAQSAFSEFYGASAATTIMSGNSGYVAPAQYVVEQRALSALTPHKYSIIIGAAPLAASTTFTLNGRSTYAAHFVWLPSSGVTQLQMADLTGGSQSTFQNYPANSGWNTVKLSGNGGNLTLSRTAATYSGMVINLFLNGGTTATSYGGANWQWTMSSAQNIFPASSNTTSFTLEIS